ncbi:DUF4101 domain-containing protein [Cyanobium sp. HWJ4-Hawea]|uniref:IMS domain-containing protein n=1 Tax=Cyanobium sp. HWJ4-Hawea TaxID=2823713 RepID=UPI0020CEDD50|nr:IMS domain-containing protein [Cyanobium sp. HWJ4-Hawea]MCP9807876.1 DUF4101 domain-containing protein [Cyanobium sp. HWJ4-Hawea]
MNLHQRMIKVSKTMASRGFSNQTALFLIAIGYPLGLIGLAIIYSSVVQNTGGSPTVSQAKIVPNEQITEQTARSVIEEWWGVRSRIFASPYDAAAASDSVAAGPLWSDLNKVDGPVAWLKNNNQNYTYQETTIKQVVSFDSQHVTNPSIVVRVKYQDILSGPGIYRPSSNTANFKYIFAEEGGRWKIWNYEKV